MRATATMLVTAAMALAAIGLAVASPGGGDLASVRLAAASGAVHVENSHAGQAVVTAAGVRPGEFAGGTVTIGNDGDASGTFVLAGTDLEETAGRYGGLLSERAQLSVVDVTDAQAHVPVFEGAVGELAQVSLGTLAPGDERDYRVRITLPNGGMPPSGTTGDNRFQDAELSIDLVWAATTTPVATATPTTPPTTPTPTPTTPDPVTPTPTPETPSVSLPDAIGLPAAKSCVKSGRMKLKLRGPNGTKVVTAKVTVNGRVKAKLKGAKARRTVTLRGLKKRTKLKVSLKASNGRTYTASRTYRACKR